MKVFKDYKHSSQIFFMNCVTKFPFYKQFVYLYLYIVIVKRPIEFLNLLCKGDKTLM